MQETRSCQNCKKDFSIEPQDFEFYSKINVPPPTFCPECRFQRRLMFRNERVLYRRSCDLCKNPMISVYAPENDQVVYCNKCWWGDAWSHEDYTAEYDPANNFFEQFLALRKRTPLPALTVDAATLINSEYVNHAGHLKNCYLVFDADSCENVLYARTAIAIKDSLDFTIMGEAELCAGDVMCGAGSSRLFYSYDSAACLNVWFSRAVVGCSDCFGCVNLKNKKYHIFNQPHSKEEYEKKITEYKLDTHEGFERAKKEAFAFWDTIPDWPTHGDTVSKDSTGEYVYASKHALDGYSSRGMEDTRFCQFITMKPVRDSYDVTEGGSNLTRIYDSLGVVFGADSVRFSYACGTEISDVEYSMLCVSSQNLFGCVGVRKGKYSILNKAYSKEEYEKLRAKIIEDMDTNPYIDSKGRVFKYGEFFPYDLSPFSYNESTAVQSFLFPLTREEAEERGWTWKEMKAGDYQATSKAVDLPQSIYDVPDAVAKELLECLECKKPFRIVQQELDLLRKLGIPAPRKCPDCRYNERNKLINRPVMRPMVCDCAGTQAKQGTYSNAMPHAHGADSCGASFNGAYPKNHSGIVYCRPCWSTEFL